MRVADLHYELPERLIARHPPERRDGARLLEVSKKGVGHHQVTDLPTLVEPGSLIVVNDTRVRHARLLGHKQSGGRAELLLVSRMAEGASAAELPSETLSSRTHHQTERWWAMIRTSKRVRPNLRLVFEAGLEAVVLAPPNDEGLAEVALYGSEPIDDLIDRIGHVPLPPYLGRADEPADRERYQTRFAAVPGAVAAPTAGLHFSDELIAALRRHCAWGAITLHVGPGTFKPVKVAQLDDHPMHAEQIIIDETIVAQVAAAKARGAPVVAVGTTVVRALESAADPNGVLRPMCGETRLLIQPGYRFRVVDALLTNFHLPGSTLLALVYAFGGRTRVAEAYAEAIRESYRFYSYGDAMWLPTRLGEAA